MIALSFQLTLFAQTGAAGAQDVIPTVSLRYDGPPAVRSLFEDVVSEFFSISADEATPATLTVRKLGNLFVAFVQFHDGTVVGSLRALQLEESLKSFEASLERVYPRRSDDISITMVPRRCRVEFEGSSISTPTTIPWKRGKLMVFKIITPYGSATDTYVPSDLPSQRLEIVPQFHRVFPDRSDGKTVVFLDGSPLTSVRTVVDGFHHLEIKRDSTVLFNGIVHIHTDLRLSSLLERLQTGKIQSDEREVFEIGDTLEFSVDGELIDVPKGTFSAVKSRGYLFFLTKDGVVDRNGRWVFNLPITKVCTDLDLIFFSDGTIWNYDKGWKKSLPNPVISCARNGKTVYLLTTSGDVYTLHLSRGTLSFLVQTNAYLMGKLGERTVVIDHEGVKTLNGELLKRTEFPVKDAVSVGSHLYLLYSVGILEVVPEGKRWFVGDGELFHTMDKVFLVSRSHGFLLELDGTTGKYVNLDGNPKLYGVVDDSFQVVSGGKLHVFR